MTCRTETKLNEYRKFVKGVASAGNKSKFEQIQQGCIGLSTESGELLDNLKKAMFQERAFDEVNAKEECGDVLFYMTELLDAIDSDIFECISLNQKKLAERYDGVRFDAQKSLKRDIDREREILEDRKNPPMPAKYSCESCADTVCGYAGQEGTACERFKDNRNYPIEPTAQVPSDDSTTAKKACCGNCAERLQLKGCSRYVKTHNDGCCIDHKFME